MKHAVCPCCKKGVQNRHLYMASLPATVICTGCGSWLTIDVKRSGSLPAFAALGIIAAVSFFWLPALVLAPVTFVISFNYRQKFSVIEAKKGAPKLWTVDRNTGELTEEATAPVMDDLKPRRAKYMQASVARKKITHISAFRRLPEHIKLRRAEKIKRSTDTELPPGLPHQ